jgi:hypothetical protein
LDWEANDYDVDELVAAAEFGDDDGLSGPWMFGSGGSIMTGGIARGESSSSSSTSSESSGHA